MSIMLRDKFFLILTLQCFCILLCLILGECHKAISSPCTPKPRAGSDQYLIGYGSLMSSKSKNRTHPNTLENRPTTVKGFSRSWNCKGVSPSLSTTYLGVYRNPRASFNGVVFKLVDQGSEAEAEEALRDFDKRERFYCRQEVMSSELEFLTGVKNSSSPVPGSQYWIYVTKSEFMAGPSEKYPIVESYVDTWLTGCFEIEEKNGLEGFAKKCVESTEGWSKHWINDRLYPRRPFLHQPNAAAIDKLLMETVPKEFNGIRISSSGPRAKIARVGGGNILLILIILLQIV